MDERPMNLKAAMEEAEVDQRHREVHRSLGRLAMTAMMKREWPLLLRVVAARKPREWRRVLRVVAARKAGQSQLGRWTTASYTADPSVLCATEQRPRGWLLPPPTVGGCP